MPVSDYPTLERAFDLLKNNPDISRDTKADNALALLFLEATGIIDKASDCKLSSALVSYGAFQIFLKTLHHRKYSTSDEKPCRWASSDTDDQVLALNKAMRGTIVSALELKCGLQSRD
jgi:hypothetical protein